MIVQMYEIQTRAEAEALAGMGVDTIGSVLTSETGWQVPSIREAVNAARENGVTSSLIPLFNTPETVFRVLDCYRPHIVHFCESLADAGGIYRETCDRLVRLQERVRERFPDIRIMRSIPMAAPGLGDRVPSLTLADMFAPVSDLFLTDTLLLPESPVSAPADQPGEGFVGITGMTCDWTVARQLVETSPIPVILAGGLSPENVYDAIVRTRPAGVDSCTATNARDEQGKSIRFRKDMERVRRFVAEARRAAADLQSAPE